MKNRRAIVQIKSSLASIGPTILFDLDPINGFQWVGTSDLTAEDILNYHPTTKREAPMRNECEAFLANLLAKGPVPARKVREATESNGFYKITVIRAKDTMNIKSKKTKGQSSQWFWEL